MRERRQSGVSCLVCSGTVEQLGFAKRFGIKSLALDVRSNPDPTNGFDDHLRGSRFSAAAQPTDQRQAGPRLVLGQVQDKCPVTLKFFVILAEQSHLGAYTGSIERVVAQERKPFVVAVVLDNAADHSPG